MVLLLFCFWWDRWGLITGFGSKNSMEGYKGTTESAEKEELLFIAFAVDELNKYYLTTNHLILFQILIRRTKAEEKLVGEGLDFCCVWSRDFALRRGKAEQWRERSQLSASSSTDFGHSLRPGSMEHLRLIISYPP